MPVEYGGQIEIRVGGEAPTGRSAVHDGWVGGAERLQLQWLLNPRDVAIGELFRAFLATIVSGEPATRT
ncbi:hypothetical protein GCM10009560_15340 [Nonomuraea longicatena]|uniref:Uncharacterized protein n=1 Tax=Nonomuraea longicatena TaxID=83682 RepID=A0ABP3ZAI0_9ACTN